MTYPNGQYAGYVYLTGTDDSLNRVSRVTDGAGVVLAQYSYLGASAVVTVDYSQPTVKYNLATGSTVATRYAGMDIFSRTATAYWQYYGSSPSDLVEINHTYDLVGNRTSREDVIAKAQTPAVDLDEVYTYDGLHRLYDLTRGLLSGGSITTPNFRQNWETQILIDYFPSLDSVGNWLELRQDNAGDGSGGWSLDQTRTHNEANEVTNIGATAGSVWPTPTYDAVGNTTSFPQPAALTSSYTAVYDAWNRLVELSADGITIATYAYDGLNRRVSKTPYSRGVAGDTRHFYYSDSWQIVEERIASHATIAERQFFWGIRYVDDLITRDRDTALDGTMDERVYSLIDDNWNVVALVNTGGSIIERFNYDAYGISTVLSSVFAPTTDGEDWETRYAGYRWDIESGVYQARNRYLHPALGRWITRDALGYAAHTFSLYEYVHSSPLGGTDPSGYVDWSKPVYIGVGKADTYNLVGSVYQVQTSQGTKIPAFVPNDKMSYWCHGFTFGGSSAKNGPFSIDFTTVPTVLNDEWKPAHCCLTQPGDILVFWKNGQLAHSGIIMSTVTNFGAVDEDKSTLKSKWGINMLRTDSWTVVAANYGKYRCYSQSPKQGCCKPPGPNEL